MRSITDIEYYFADMIVRHAGGLSADAQEKLRHLAMAALNAVRLAHTCIDVEAWCAGEEPQMIPSKLTAPQWREFMTALPPAVMARENNAEAPFIWDEKRHFIYLNRFWNCENDVRNYLQRHTIEEPLPENTDEMAQIASMCRYFKNDGSRNLQAQAVYAALKNPLQVVTGGPGTGKTTVMAVMVAMLLKECPALRVALCAPTGKAASRMREAVEMAIAPQGALIVDDDIREKMSRLHPKTLHTLLSIHPDSGRAAFNEENTLPYDLVVVDECSMTSLELFSQLFKALDSSCRLLLLGDRNQLASVEAGAVFGAVCDYYRRHGGGRQVTTLTENHRSKANPALCAYVQQVVSSATNNPALWGEMTPDAPSGLFVKYQISAPAPQMREHLLRALRRVIECIDARIPDGEPHLSDYRHIKRVEDALKLNNRLKCLCPIRDGLFGVNSMNDLVAEAVGLPRGEFPDGLPLMILQNSRDTGLANGDIGVCFNGLVWFDGRKADGTVDRRCFAPAQLPPFERAFAMTIHKSQGSDYDSVLMTLPSRDVPLLTRELIYTGITRTKRDFYLLAEHPDEGVAAAVARPTIRWTGL